MKLRRLVLPVAVAMTFTGASPALARNFLVSPGSTEEGTCSVGHECNFEYAVDTAQDFDQVTMAPGNYPLQNTLTVGKKIVIQGTVGQPRPVISLFGPNTFATLNVLALGTVLRHIEVTSQLDPNLGTASTLVLHDSTIEDSVIRATTPGTSAVTISDGSAVRNSVLRMDGPNVDGAVGLRGDVELRNVTITGVAGNGRAAIARCLDVNVGGSFRFINTIAGPSTQVGQIHPPATLFADGRNCDAGFKPHIRATSSSFDSVQVDAGGIYDDDGGNINSVVNPAKLAADGIHELAGSPTIDAGIVDALTPFDFDGDRRVLGTRVDIGADEFVTPGVPAPTVTPAPANPAPTFPPPITPTILPVPVVPNGLSGLSATGTKSTSSTPPKVRFTLSAAQRIPFKISALLAGRKHGSKCISPAGKKGVRCVSVRLVNTGTITAAKGRNEIALGSNGGTQFSPGRYRVTVSPNGQRAQSVDFQVVSGKKKKSTKK